MAKSTGKKSGGKKASRKKGSNDALLPAVVTKPNDSKAKQEKKEPEELISYEHRKVQINFTPEELGPKSRQLANTITVREQLQLEQKEVIANFKQMIQAKETEIGLLSKQISQGYEMKDVKVEVRKNFTTRLKTYWYNGQMVDSAPLSPEDLHEMQTKMEFAE